MSRFYSQIVTPDQEGYWNPNVAARNAAPPPPRVGITESLQSPGLAITGPYSRGAFLLQQAERTLGLVGDTVGAVASLERQRQSARESELALLEHFDNKERRVQEEMDVRDKATASVQLNRYLPQVVADIQAGNIKTGGPNSDAALVDQLLGQFANGQSAAYHDEVFRAGAPILTRAIVDAREKRVAQIQKDDLNLVAAGAAHAATPEEFAQYADSLAASHPDLSPQQRWAAVTLQALGTAAAEGNSSQLDTISRAVDKAGYKDLFAEAIANSRTAVQQRLNGEQAIRDKNFHNDIAAFLTPEVGPPPPKEIAQDRINQWRDRASPNSIQSELDGLDERYRRMSAEYLKAQSATYESAITARYAQMDQALLQTGIGPAFQSLKITRPDGTTFELTPDERKKNAALAFNDSIDATIPKDGITARANIAAKMKFYANAAMKNPEWTGSYAAWPSLINPDMTPDQVPAEALKKWNDWVVMGEINPQVRDDHLSRDSLYFGRMTETLVNSLRTTPQDAMIKIVRASVRGEDGSLRLKEPVPRNELAQTLRLHLGLGQDQPVPFEVFNGVERKAQLYHITGVPMTEAISQSIKDFDSDTKNIGGNYVNIHGHPIARTMDVDVMQRAIVGAYVAGTDKNPDNYSLFVNPENGTWSVRDNILLHVDESLHLTDHDMELIWGGINYPGAYEAQKKAAADEFRAPIEGLVKQESRQRFGFGGGALAKVGMTLWPIDIPDSVYEQAGIARPKQSIELAEGNPFVAKTIDLYTKNQPKPVMQSIGEAQGQSRHYGP